MGNFEVIAHMKIRAGQLDGFTAQAAELMRLTRQKDTKTLRYDWFIDEAAMECEVHELYTSEEGLIEHNMHVVDARDALFKNYASDHRMSFFGRVSSQIVELTKMHGGSPAVYSFVQGLAEPAKEKPASAHAAL